MGGERGGAVQARRRSCRAIVSRPVVGSAIHSELFTMAAPALPHSGNTHLHMACMFNRSEVACALLEAGADSTVKVP